MGSPEADIDPIVASPRHQEGAAEELGLVLVSIYGVSLAVPAAAVASISVVGSPTPLPGAPPHIAGLVAAGERAMPLVDLEILLAIDGRGRAAPDPLFRRTLFVAAGGLEAGLVCHRARGLISITADALREPTVFQGKRLRPLLAAEIEARGGVVGVLDVPALLEAAAVA